VGNRSNSELSSWRRGRIGNAAVVGWYRTNLFRVIHADERRWRFKNFLTLPSEFGIQRGRVYAAQAELKPRHQNFFSGRIRRSSRGFLPFFNLGVSHGHAHHIARWMRSSVCGPNPRRANANAQYAVPWASLTAREIRAVSFFSGDNDMGTPFFAIVQRRHLDLHFFAIVDGSSNCFPRWRFGLRRADVRRRCRAS